MGVRVYKTTELFLQRLCHFLNFNKNFRQNRQNEAKTVKFVLFGNGISLWQTNWSYRFMLNQIKIKNYGKSKWHY